MQQGRRSRAVVAKQRRKTGTWPLRVDWPIGSRHCDLGQAGTVDQRQPFRRKNQDRSSPNISDTVVVYPIDTLRKTALGVSEPLSYLRVVSRLSDRGRGSVLVRQRSCS